MAPENKQAGLYDNYRGELRLKENNLVTGYCKTVSEGFPGGAVVESPPADAGDTGSSPGPGRSHMPWSS